MSTLADIDPEAVKGTDTGAEEPTVRYVDGHDAGIEALASRTARQIAVTLAESTATANELAVITDTSIQNVHYHLERLQAAAIVEAIGTAYSSRGREMDVYALSGSPLVFVLGTGDEDFATRLADPAHDSVGSGS